MHINSFKSGDENGRLAALSRYEVLDTEQEKEFTDIVSLVKSIFGVPIAAINLIDRDRQWTKAGLGGVPTTLPRSETFCSETIREDRPMMVTDALLDERFSRNTLVAGEGGVRSYLGVPLRSDDGYNIGTLCIYDSKVREFTETEVDVMNNFARVVMSQLELRLTARVDGLTGALTARAFADRVDRHRVQRNPGAASLVLMDIDSFKEVNDRFGHAAGDEVLRTVVTTICGLMRKSDSFGRLGGEEFGVFLPGTVPENAMHLVRRIQSALAALPLDAIGGAHITLSMGLAGFSPGESREAWYERADRALYLAKSGGRNQLVMAQPGAGG